MVLFLPSSSGIAKGEAEAVGIHHVPATVQNPPFRIYYPAQSPTQKQVGYFDDTSLAFFLQGYWSVLLSRQRKSLLFQIGLVVLQCASYLLPLRYLKLPQVYQDAVPVSNGSKHPLILFSHGLTGTGQENSILLSAWAKQGYVVVSVHHTDGSSNRVCQANGQDLWYDPGPPVVNYDPTFRPTQIQKRVTELLQARNWLQQHIDGTKGKDPGPNNSAGALHGSRMVDWETTIVAGFSYGAATAALLATISPQRLPSLKAVVLLDGWFYIDVSQSAKVEFEFPQEAFATESTKILSKIPALFLNSQQFRKSPKLWAATNQLARRFCHTAEPQVISGSSHNNFCDVVFWVPTGLLQKSKAIGPCDPRDAYEEIVRRTSDFLKQHQRNGWSVGA